MESGSWAAGTDTKAPKSESVDVWRVWACDCVECTFDEARVCEAESEGRGSGANSSGGGVCVGEARGVGGEKSVAKMSSLSVSSVISLCWGAGWVGGGRGMSGSKGISIGASGCMFVF